LLEELIEHEVDQPEPQFEQLMACSTAACEQPTAQAALQLAGQNLHQWDQL